MAEKVIIGNATLYHGDCREVLPTLPKHDLLLTDPPYGIGIDGQRQSLSTARKAHEFLGWDNETPPQWLFGLMHEKAVAHIIWGGNYYPLPSNKRCVIWDKMQPEKLSFGMFDYAWTSFDGANKIFRQSVQLEANKIHPIQNPVALYKWLLKNYAKPGDKILDTHGGSMSIAIACYDLGFDLTLCELDKDYYEAGKKRFNDHVAKYEPAHLVPATAKGELKLF